MARTKISEFSATAADNTDIDSIDIAEGCAPSGINNAIRELMAQLKDFQTGAAGDPFNGAVNGTVGATTPAAGAFTTLSASSTVSGTGFSNYFASPPAIGGTAAAAGTFTNLAYTGTLTGGTGVINIGSGQVYKDASGNVGIGTSLPGAKLQVNSEIQVVSGSNIGRFLTDGSNFYVGTRSAIPMRFETNSTTQAILDTSGNLGLGVTPSAWASGKAFEINIAGNAVWSGPGYLNLMQNVVYASAAYRYGANGTACRYEQTAGQHLWLTAPSGTAGNAISFTQAMTLNASGSLLVGTTSANAKLTVNAGNADAAYFASAQSGYGGQVKLTNANGGVPNPNKHLRISDGAGQLEIVNSAYSAVIFQFYDAGTAYNSTGTWGTISDERVKENIESAGGYLDRLLQLRVVKYSLKSENSQTPTKLGFLAGEVEQVFPNLIETTSDTFNNIPDLKQIKLSVLTPMLVKAIQELSAQQASLKAEFDAYKAAHP